VNVSIKSVLCPVDFSDSSEHALTYAIALTQSYDATLKLLHVVQPPLMSVPGDPMVPEFSSDVMQDIAAASQRRLDEIAAKAREQVSDVEAEIATGSPFVEIITFAKDQDVDLIVIGTHGRTGLAHVMIGSVAEKVVRKAPCPVLTVKHPEHEFVML